MAPSDARLGETSSQDGIELGHKICTDSEGRHKGPLITAQSQPDVRASGPPGCATMVHVVAARRAEPGYQGTRNGGGRHWSPTPSPECRRPRKLFPLWGCQDADQDLASGPYPNSGLQLGVGAFELGSPAASHIGHWHPCPCCSPQDRIITQAPRAHVGAQRGSRAALG